MENQQFEKDGLIFVGVSVFAWGLTGIFVRLLSGLSPLFLTGLRFLFAFFATLPIVLLSGEKRRLLGRTLGRPEAWILGLALVANYFLAVTAYQLASVAEVALFLGTAPLFVLVAKAVRGKAVEGRERNGALFAVTGMALVLAPGMSLGAFSGKRILGIVCSVLAAAASAHYSGMTRALHTKVGHAADATVLTLLAFGIGAFVPLMAAGLLGTANLSALAVPAVATRMIAFSIFCTTVPTITYALAAQKLPPTIVTTAQLMIPVVATIAAAFVLRDIPSWSLIPGGLMVLLGIRHMFADSSPRQNTAEGVAVAEFSAGD